MGVTNAAAQGRVTGGGIMSSRKKVKTKVKHEATSKSEATKSGVAAQKAETATPVVVKTQKLKVLKKDTKYRGAREAWFNRLVEYDGKTEGEFIQSTTEKPPALTKNGTPEAPSGWIRFFVRSGVLSLHN